MSRVFPCLLVALVYVSFTARAEDKALEPRRVAPVLPTLRVSAPGDGESKIEVGASIARSLGADWDLVLSPSASAQTKDSASKVLDWMGGSKSKLSSSGASVGLDAAFVRMGSLRTPADEDLATPQLATYDLCRSKCPRPPNKDARDWCEKDDEGIRKDKVSAFEKWLKDCKDKSDVGAECAQAPAMRTSWEACTSKAEKESCQDEVLGRHGAHAFADANIEANHGISADLCSEGNDFLVQQRKEKRDRQAALPDKQLSVGFRAGLSSFEYVDAAPGKPAVEAQKNTFGDWKVGASIVFVTDAGTVFEVPVSYARGREAGDSTVRWCEPSGQVKTDSGDAPAQSCEEKPKGVPALAGTFDAKLLFGIVDTHSLSPVWRVSVGPTAAVKADASNKRTVDLGLAAPLYLAFGSFPVAYTGEMKATVRLTAYFGAHEEDAKWAAQGGLRLEVLVGRGLFGGPFDY